MLTLRKTNKINKMATPENEILFPENIIKAPSQKDCKKIECIVNTIEALARCTNKGMYIIDYHKKNFLYVSQGMAQLLEKTEKEILDAGSSIYTELIPEEDQNIIREINKQGRIKLNETPISEKLNYSLSYDFQIICDGKKRMINNQMTPLLLNSKGEIWLTLGTIALSTSQNSGNGILRKNGISEYWIYNPDKKGWTLCTEYKLSKFEKEILRLSAQGLKVDEIAVLFGKQRDHIKNYKRLLFKKLNVHNISEAITYTTNFHLLNY